MAKDFRDVIIEIMPLVKTGSDLPFMINREDGKWNVNYFTLDTTATPEQIKTQAAEYLMSIREKDPFVKVHTGADFANGSFAVVYDKILCSRLRAEYDAVPFGEVHGGEFMALINAFEDNIESFSQDTIDYLLTYDNPLRELYDLNSIPLWNRSGDNNEPYIEENVTEFIEAVEYKITELIKTSEQSQSIDNQNNSDNRNGFSDAKANPYEPTHCISSVEINGFEIEIGEDTSQKEPFYVETSKDGSFTFGMRTDNLVTALEAYSGQIKERAVELQREIEGKPPLVALTSEHCLPNSKDADFTGKLIIVDANSLLPEYRSSESQLLQCTHGNGARPNAKGRSVFCKELYSGDSVVYDRSQVLGISDESKLPKWAKEKIGYIEHPAKEQQKAATTPKPTRIAEQPQRKPSILSDLDDAIKEAAKIAERKSGNHTKKRGDMEVD